MTTHLTVLSNSRSRSARRCLRKAFYRYEIHQRPLAQSEALTFGLGVHGALERWLEQYSEQGAQVPASCLLYESDFDDPFAYRKAYAMLSFYHERWRSERWEVLAVEAEFRAPLVNPETGRPSRTFELGGRLDGVIRERDTGDVYVLEHKTSGEDISPGADYWQRLRIDSQISTYMVGARALGFEPAGVIYDVLGKPGMRPLKATPEDQRKYTKPTKKNPEPRLYANQRESDETPEEYFERLVEHIGADPDRYLARAKIPRLEDDEVEAARDVWLWGQVIRQAQATGSWPRNPDACHRYGRFCSYWDVCTGLADIDDPALFERDERYPTTTKETESA